MAKRFRKCPQCGTSHKQSYFNCRPGYGNAENKRRAKMQVCRDCQTPFRRDAGFSSYASRDAVLRSIGFNSYQEYLKSDKWKKIRARVLKKDGYQCKLCGNRATLVHHQLYRKQELHGQSLRGMVSLCAECHNRVEFDDVGKVGHHAATWRLRREARLLG